MRPRTRVAGTAPRRRRRLVPASLRGRLLLGVVTLVAAGLCGADLAAYLMLASFMDSRVDQQLRATGARIAATLARPIRPRLTTDDLAKLSPGSSLVLFFDQQGRLLAPRVTPDRPQQAALAAAIGPLPAPAVRGRAGQLGRVSADGTAYRVAYVPADGPVVVTSPQDPGSAVRGIVLADSLADDQSTLARLVSIEVTVTGVALLTLGGCAVAVLWLGLRPLGVMAGTAVAIAEGHTDRRIPVAHPGTETGRLAAALNEAFRRRQQAEERLRRFAVDVSHELRTPLSLIRGWAELYFQMSPVDDDAVQTAMSRIADEATRMGTLVDELLLLAKLDQQPALSRGSVALEPLVRDVVADAHVIDPGRPITLDVEAGDGSAVAVLGDGDRLRQVVRNLIGNAFQHTPPGTPVRIVLEAPSTSGPRTVRLRVADDGPGIPGDRQACIFERFYRADSTRTVAGGHGLGLSIVQAIVHAHHGTVGVRSAPGQGSEFLVTLPAAPAHLAPSVAAPCEPDNGGMRIPTHRAVTKRCG